MDLLTQYRQYVSHHGIYDDSHQLLIAVSGGRDSMCLLELARQGENNITIAHINYGLRAEAEAETALVAQWAEQHEIPLLVHRVTPPTEDFNVQKWARSIRFEWMQSLCEQHGFDRILTGAQMEDQVETLVFNLSRGCGLKGSRGMKPLNGNIGHPLLFASRDDITEYNAAHEIPYLDDASNAQTKYTRNKIRHNIMPQLDDIHPSAIKNWAAFTQKMGEFEAYIKQSIVKLLKQHQTPDGWRIASPKVNEEQLLIQYWLEDEGLTSDQIDQLLNKRKSHLKIGNYSAFWEGDELTIESVSGKPSWAGILAEAVDFEKYVGQLETLNEVPKQFNTASSHGYFDADKLLFPLEVRSWTPGDRFHPFGMRGSKTVGDFLTDLKMPVAKRENISVLVSNNQIAWVIGLRIDDRFKVDAQTKKVYHCKVDL